MFRKEKNYCKWIFFLYVFIIIRLIIFKYSYRELWLIMSDWNPGVIAEGLSQANFKLFKTIRMYIIYYERLNSFENLFGNVLIFIPYGFFYSLSYGMKKGRRLFAPCTLLFVFGIEIVQLISGLGKFDVDDILLNCFGALIGFAIKELFFHCR